MITIVSPSAAKDFEGRERHDMIDIAVYIVYNYVKGKEALKKILKEHWLYENEVWVNAIRYEFNRLNNNPGYYNTHRGNMKSYMNYKALTNYKKSIREI